MSKKIKSILLCLSFVASMQSAQDFDDSNGYVSPCNKQQLLQTIGKGWQYTKSIFGAIYGIFPSTPQIFKTGISGYTADTLSFVLKRVMDSSTENAAQLFEDQPGNKGHGARLFENAFNAAGNQFAQGGAGERVMNNVFSAFGSQFEQGGAARNASNGALRMVGDLFRDGGEARNAFTDASRMVRQEFADGGEARHAAQEGTALVNEAINNVGDTMTGQTNKFLSTIVKNYGKGAAITVGSAGAIITAYYGSKLLWQQIDKALNTPSLIIKSSKKSLRQRIFGASSPKVPDMIFSLAMTKKLDDIIKSSLVISKKIATGDTTVKYRNLLLWGPPGTGKTMFAEKLALSSGMDFAMMSGASFSKFQNGKGIQALDELFAWANKSKKGLLLFIDEAESFLSERSGNDATSDSYLLLNSFLNHTGTRSSKFMIVFATNHPEVLDKAMARRIDDSIKMDLPECEERYKILELYINQILLQSSASADGKEVVKTVLSEQALRVIAQETEGLSCGELEGIINTIKTSADASEVGMITTELVDEVVRAAIAKNKEFVTGFGNNT